MTSLPPELILDILSRLPVKSLCRFKCVSKSWLNLINDPRFVKMHLKRTQRQRLFIAHKFLYNVDLETITYDDDKVVAVEDDSLGWKSINVESPCWPSNHYHRQLPKWINFIGSCNGLLCLEVFNHILLYNPSTKERKQIPKFHSVTRKLRGFGYVESVDDYKFVEIDYWGKCVAVYSLRNDSWTSIEIDRYLIDTNNVEGIFINGAIHWLVDIEGRMEILAFDLVEKKFEILPPPDIDRVFRDAYFIGLLGGCLCFSMQGNESCGEVWVMKEYGLKGSWTKIMMIPNVFYELKPLCYLNTSDKMLLFMNAQRLVFRNAKDGNLKNIEVDGDEMDDIDADDADWRDINMYVESLVSPCCKRYVQSEVLEDWFLVEGCEERRVLKT